MFRRELSRLRTHVFPLIGQRPIAELDTHDLLEVTQRIKGRGTMDVALRVQNYLSTIMRRGGSLPKRPSIANSLLYVAPPRQHWAGAIRQGDGLPGRWPGKAKKCV